jgi:ABC-type lipoprotein release transport system permease subunit
LGFVAGVLAASMSSAAGEGAQIQIVGADFSLVGLLLASVGGAAALAVIAGWIPALIATRQDPAVVLHEE